MTSASRFSTRPLYLQVRDLLVQRITNGEWHPGGSIPNESQLARELTISIGTVRKALEEMEQEHIIVRRQGRGTFVNDQASEEMSIRFSNIRDENGQRFEGSIEATTIVRGPASEQEIEALQLRASDAVVRIDRVHSHDGRPFMVERASLPAALFPNLPEDFGKYRICALAQSNGLLLRDADEVVSLDTASPDDASVLGLAKGAPILLLDRRIHAIDGRIAEWRVARCHLNGMRYRAQIS